MACDAAPQCRDHGERIIMSMKLPLFDTVKHAYEYRHEPEELRVLADIYWKSLLIFSAVVIVLLLGYGVWQLTSVISSLSSVSGSSSGSTSLPLDKKDLQSALGGLAGRRTAAQELEGAPVGAPDPSVAK